MGKMIPSLHRKSTDPLISAGLCDELPVPDNGTVMMTGQTQGSNATYTCNDSYQLTGGNSTRTCMDTGLWSGEEPTCLRMKNPFVMCTHLHKVTVKYVSREFYHV